IIHQEMPKGDGKGRMLGFQLWSNLPRSHKMMDPRYLEVKTAQIPIVKTPSGASIRVVAGELGGVRGPVRDIVSDPEYLDVSLAPKSSWVHPVKEGHTVFAYVFEGEGYFDPGRDPHAPGSSGKGSGEKDRSAVSGDGSVILYGPGNRIAVTSDQKHVRFLLVSGKPLGEPIAWYGPIVMNTRKELATAFEEFEKGTFVKGQKR
ncbi:MAG TPA: pirin-like C-terminal cupin domain-containing protein, partial [Planctomycetota bacterium]|nr:pirin-like C-terminal cupin domain-containing protein [Planctomycetota bacterium]